MAEEPAPAENGHVEQPDGAANGPGKRSKAEKKKEKKQKHKQNRQQRRYWLLLLLLLLAGHEDSMQCLSVHSMRGCFIDFPQCTQAATTAAEAWGWRACCCFHGEEHGSSLRCTSLLQRSLPTVLLTACTQMIACYCTCHRSAAPIGRSPKPTLRACCACSVGSRHSYATVHTSV
jgi:hypothetical protein